MPEPPAISITLPPSDNTSTPFEAIGSTNAMLEEPVVSRNRSTTDPAHMHVHGHFGVLKHKVEHHEKKAKHFHLVRFPRPLQWWRNDGERLIMVREGHFGRSSTFRELFFDLVFVLSVAALAHPLRENNDPGQFGLLLLIFCIQFECVFQVWLDSTKLVNRFDRTDLISYGYFVTVMFATMFLGIFSTPNPLDGVPNIGFPIGLVIAKTSQHLWHAWIGAWPKLPGAVYGRAQGAQGLLAMIPLVISIFTPAVAQAPLWALTVVIDWIWHWIQFDIVRPCPPWKPADEAKLMAARLPIAIEHFVERVGLFCIIVLGENIVAVFSHGQTHLPLRLLILIVVIQLFMIYFIADWHGFSTHAARFSRWSGLSWTFLHHLYLMSLTLAGTGASRIVAVGVASSAPAGDTTTSEHATSNDPPPPSSPPSSPGADTPPWALIDRWLFCGSVAAVLLSTLLMAICHHYEEGLKSWHGVRFGVRGVVSVILAALPAIDYWGMLHAEGTAGLVAGLLALQLIIEFFSARIVHHRQNDDALTDDEDEEDDVEMTEGFEDEEAPESPVVPRSPKIVKSTSFPLSVPRSPKIVRSPSFPLSPI